MVEVHYQDLSMETGSWGTPQDGDPRRRADPGQAAPSRGDRAGRETGARSTDFCLLGWLGKIAKLRPRDILQKVIRANRRLSSKQNATLH